MLIRVLGAKIRGFLMINSYKNKGFLSKIVLVLFAIVVVALYCINSFTYHLNVDEREHVYSSYMIYNGYLPYKDFFEHHHPLLWYTFAPFLKWFKNSPEIWYIIRVYAVVINIGILYYIYKIGEFVGINKREAIVASLLYLTFYAVWVGGKEFRPDSLGLLFFTAGIYYFFVYVQKTDFRKLIISYVLFFLSFMTMQKMSLSLFVMGLIILFLPRTKKNIKLEIWWLVVPLYGALGYVGYLYYNDALRDYFELNWILNLELSIVGRLYNRLLFIAPILVSLVCLCLFRTGNYYCRAIIILFEVQVIIVLWYAPFIHYLLPMYPFMVVLLVYCIKKLFASNTIFVLYGLMFALILRGGYLINSYDSSTLSSYVKMSRIELNVTNENDEIIPGDIWSGGLRKSALGYYWFGWSIALLDYKLFKRHEFPDLNKIIKEKKPKLIANNDAVMMGCLNDKNEQVLEQCYRLQLIDEASLEDDYRVSDFIYLRKY